MSKSNTLERALLDHRYGGPDYTRPATVYVALFTVAPTDAGGGTEVSGGGYARKAVTNNATNFPNAATDGNGKTTKTNGVAISFDAFTADIGIILAWALFDAASAGTLMDWGEFLGEGKVFSVDASTDTLTSAAHGFTNGQAVRVRNKDGTLPTGLSASTKYYIVGATTNTFQLSLTAGGAAVDITAVGSGTHSAHLDSFKDFAQNDILTIPVGYMVIEED